MGDAVACAEEPGSRLELRRLERLVTDGGFHDGTESKSPERGAVLMLGIRRDAGVSGRLHHAEASIPAWLQLSLILGGGLDAIWCCYINASKRVTSITGTCIYLGG